MVDEELELLYRELLLEHCRRPRGRQPLASPAASARTRNPLCGDEVLIELEVDKGYIHGISARGRGCVISQASASLLAERLNGMTIIDAQALDKAFRAFLRDEPDSETDRLGDLRALGGLKKMPSRQRCALLCWDRLGCGEPFPWMMKPTGAKQMGAEEKRIDEATVIDAIRPVRDPEVGFSIVDMGLIYRVRLEKDGTQVKVEMTLTSPMCPLGPQIIAATEAAVETIENVEKATVELVWNPPWDPAEMASEEVKDRLGIW